MSIPIKNIKINSKELLLLYLRSVLCDIFHLDEMYGMFINNEFDIIFYLNIINYVIS